MNCEDLEHALLDGILRTRTSTESAGTGSHRESVRERIDQLTGSRLHLAQCASCRARLEAEESLDRAIDLWKTQQPAPSPTDAHWLDAVLREADVPDVVTTSAPVSFGSGRRRRRIAWLAAAGLGVTAFTVFLALPRNEPEMRLQTTLAARPHDAAEIVEVQETLTQLWDDVQSVPSEGLAAVSRTSPLRPGRVWELAKIPGIAPSPTDVSSDSRDGRTASTDWVPRSRPISQPLASAFGFLSEILPDDGPPAS